jgi:hypothetical protein
MWYVYPQIIELRIWEETIDSEGKKIWLGNSVSRVPIVNLMQ